MTTAREVLEGLELDPAMVSLLLGADDEALHNVGDRACPRGRALEVTRWELGATEVYCQDCAWDAVTLITWDGKCFCTDYFETHAVTTSPDVLGVQELREVIHANHSARGYIPAAEEVLLRAVDLLAHERYQELRDYYMDVELTLLRDQVTHLRAVGLTDLAKGVDRELTKAFAGAMRWALVADSEPIHDGILAMVLKRNRYGKVFLVPDGVAAHLIRISENNRGCVIIKDRDERLAEAVGAVYDPTKGSSTSTLKKALKVAQAL